MKIKVVRTDPEYQIVLTLDEARILKNFIGSLNLDDYSHIREKYNNSGMFSPWDIDDVDPVLDGLYGLLATELDDEPA